MRKYCSYIHMFMLYFASAGTSIELGRIQSDVEMALFRLSMLIL